MRMTRCGSLLGTVRQGRREEARGVLRVDSGEPDQRLRQGVCVYGLINWWGGGCNGGGTPGLQALHAT